MLYSITSSARASNIGGRRIHDLEMAWVAYAVVCLGGVQGLPLTAHHLCACPHPLNGPYVGSGA
jgi:hypothetical protein